MSGRMSAKTGRAPRSTNAFTVETNVNDGTITSSPGRKSSSSAAISSACVHDVVSSARRTPSVLSSSAWQRLGERVVASERAGARRLRDVLELATDDRSAIEGNAYLAHGEQPNSRPAVLRKAIRADVEIAEREHVLPERRRRQLDSADSLMREKADASGPASSLARRHRVRRPRAESRCGTGLRRGRALHARSSSEALVAADTTNPPGNEARAVAVGAERLEAAGIPYQVSEFAPGPREPGRAPRRRRLAPPLLLLAHIDVVGTRRSGVVEPIRTR